MNNNWADIFGSARNRRTRLTKSEHTSYVDVIKTTKTSQELKSMEQLKKEINSPEFNKLKAKIKK